MNWDAIGAMGDLLGSVAVFATLIYLAIQVRSSKDLLTASLLERLTVR